MAPLPGSATAISIDTPKRSAACSEAPPAARTWPTLSDAVVACVPQASASGVCPMMSRASTRAPTAMRRSATAQ
eukprot:6713252-Prymnesium_polylepis.3